MKTFGNFINLLVSGDYFVVFIAVMLVIIASIIVYLIKLQITSPFEYTEKKEEIKPPKITQIKVEDKPKEERPIYVQSKFNFNENELKNDLFQVGDDVLVRTQELKNLSEDIKEIEEKPAEKEIEIRSQVTNNINYQKEENKYKNIENYEKEQEENAIISYEELSKRKDDIANGVYSISEEVIDEYEDEQEKKAIISYDELLEKASSSVLQYQEANVPGLKISRVDIVDKNNPVPPKKPYYYEEAFLKALKEFRATL